MFLWILFFAWLITKAIHQGRAEHALAEKGIVPPRMAAKYGAEGAAQRVAKYGLPNHILDVGRDFWARRTDAVIAARDAKAKGEDPKAAAAKVLDGDEESATPDKERASTIPDAAVEPEPTQAAGSDAETEAPEATVVHTDQHDYCAPSTGCGPECPRSQPVTYGWRCPNCHTYRESFATEQEAQTDRATHRCPLPEQSPQPTNGNVVSLDARRDGSGRTQEQVAVLLVSRANGECIHPVPGTENGLCGEYVWDEIQGGPTGNDKCRKHTPAELVRRMSADRDTDKTSQQEEPMTSPAPMTPTVPTGEAATVDQLVEQAKLTRLHAEAMKERTDAAVKDLAKTVETLEASAVEMEMPKPVTDAIAQAREAVASLSATLGGVTQEVDATMAALVDAAGRHQTVSEMKAGLKGLAKSGAY